MASGLCREGVTVVLIDHKLAELVAFCSSVTVLRGGRTVARLTGADMDERKLMELLLGRVGLAGTQSEEKETEPADRGGAVALNVVGLWSRDETGGNLEDIHLSVNRGEVHGLAGSETGGSETLLRSVWGISRIDSGRVEFGSAESAPGALSYIPADSGGEGLINEFSLWENLLLRSRKLVRCFGIFILRKSARRMCLEVMDRFDVRPKDPETKAGHLSGGNRRRFMVGMSLHPRPRIALASCPTRGMDLDGIRSTHTALGNLAAGGGAVLTTSRDLEELCGNSHRITAFFNGRASASQNSRTADPVEIGMFVATGRTE
jgi:simple sugar transport system ATP-binding protein